ncbi:glycosyl hydrolase family 28-related protein, partial [Limnoraphis robusta]|uniref:glycosyl hydrolase family 28-related protein n=1 Tax=Limnoraphis robusta TaxID=1118279 RepID=UPI00191050DA
MTTFLSDDFNNSSLSSQWSFIDPVGNSSYSLSGTNTKDAYLNLSVPSGSSHDIWNNTLTAARVMQPATNTDFELEVKFASEPAQRYQIQGILVEQNANNWLRFDTFHDGSQLFVFAAATINGSSQEKMLAEIDSGEASHLRVNRQGSTWTLEYSADGQTWASAGSFTQALNVTSVGTFAGNAGNNNPAFTSQVDYFFNTAAPIRLEDGNQLSIDNDISVTENDTGTTTLNFTVSLLEASDEVVTVDFSTESATATEGVDYLGSSGTLSFAPGVTEQTISVEVQGDENIEPYESFFVNLFNPSNASIGDSQAIVTITDDDVDSNFPQVKFPDDAGMVNIKDYGAKGDGVTDDTAAIQQALAENRVIHFPNGTYLVSDTLQWGDTKRLVLQGESQDKTIIKLKDNLAAFNNSSSPKPLLTTFEGQSTGQAFQNSIYNLSVDVGAGNAGAIGIRFTSNNQGGLRDVTIRSSDPNNLGKTGLALTKPWPGPSLFKNVTVEGFNYGVEVNHPEYSNVFENLTLRDQKIAGISNNGNILSIRGLTSNNSVPVIENNDDKGMITLIDGNFEGGSSQTSAINLKAGTLYARNITTEGYQSALKKGNSIVSGNSISEYVSSPAYSLFPSPQTSLQLDVPELPEIRYDNLSNWANVTDFGAIASDNQDDSAAIQAALNSGKSTIYFPGGRYNINNTLEVGGNVKLITGASYQTVLTVGGNLKNQDQPVFRFESTNQDTVTLERFFGDYGGGNFHWVEQASPNTLVLRNFAVGSGSAYRNSVPGELIIEDVAASDWVFDEQKVWAWQLNPEGFTTKITNNGGQLWVLGLKTEKEGTIIETTAGGQTEVLGGLIYPASRGDLIPSQQPAFINDESQLTIAGVGESRYNVGSYNILVEETRNGVTETLLNDSNILRRGQGFEIPLYTGFQDSSGNLNQAPVAVNDSLTIDSVESIVIDVLSNDSDRDGRLDPTSVTINNQPSQGEVSVDLTTGAITYTPDASFTNNDSFTYTVQDDDGETSNVATVSITLDANQATVANNDTASVSRGQFVEINVLANDSDSDGTVDPLTVEIAQPPAYGEVLVNSNGTISYTHNGSNTTSDSFTYAVRDDEAAQSNVASVNLTIETPSQNMTTFLSDDFNNSSLKSQWSFVDPVGNSSYSLTGTNTEDAYLNLSVPSGSSHDLWNNNVKAARVMQPATNSDFELEAKFASVPSQKFQIQGILVQQNATNWLRFDTFHDGSQLKVFAAATINGSSQEKLIANINPTQASHLRVNRQGSTWKLEYSADGQTWASAGSFTQALNVTSVGTFAGNAGNNAPAFTSQVDYFFNTAAPIVPEDVALPNQAPVANDD